MFWLLPSFCYCARCCWYPVKLWFEWNGSRANIVQGAPNQLWRCTEQCGVVRAQRPRGLRKVTDSTALAELLSLLWVMHILNMTDASVLCGVLRGSSLISPMLRSSVERGWCFSFSKWGATGCPNKMTAQMAAANEWFSSSLGFDQK